MRNGKRIHKIVVRHNEDCYNGNAIGVEAVAEVHLPNTESRGSDSIVQVIHSGGLWNIDVRESAEYVASVEQEQLAELRGQLHAIGFSKRAITAAFREVANG